MKIGDIIRKARLDAGLSLTAVAEKTGISKSHLSQTELGETKSPSFDVLGRLADFYGLSLDALYLASQAKNSSAVVAAGTRRPINIPIIPWQEIQHWQAYGKQADNAVISPFLCSEDSFAVRITNDSMTASHGSLMSFPEGCTIIVDTTVPADNKSYVIAIGRHDNNATFKQLVVDGSTQYLKPINPQYPIMSFDQMIIVGVVIGYIQPTK